ncbi:MAG: hypothetical protein JWN30_580 [Bacilli bacterium]|nr:hypothetical protein [Bacilli bacterium]
MRVKLFGAMAVLVLFMGAAYFISTQGYLRNNLPVLVSAAEQAKTGEILQLQQSIYDEMIHMTFKVVAGLSVIALLIGFWLSHKLTLPLGQLSLAIGRIGNGELGITLPVTTQDEFGEVTEALNRMTENLSRSEEVRKHLAADVAHELRTPLTILQGQFELIQQSGQAVLPETLLPMQDELIRLSRLVNDLHQLSLAEAGKLPLQKKSTDLLQLLDRMNVMFRMEAEEKGVRLTITSVVEEAVLVVDSHRITQVFYNLIGNAIRYTREGGQVSILLSEETGMNRNGYSISITDTGIGIPAEHLPYVFNRFYRVEDDRSRQSGGMGLGLAIAKQYVEAHDGQIDVHSQSDQGTTFRIYLPR